MSRAPYVSEDSQMTGFHDTLCPHEEDERPAGLGGHTHTFRSLRGSGLASLPGLAQASVPTVRNTFLEFPTCPDEDEDVWILDDDPRRLFSDSVVQDRSLRDALEMHDVRSLHRQLLQGSACSDAPGGAEHFGRGGLPFNHGGGSCLLQEDAWPKRMPLHVQATTTLNGLPGPCQAQEEEPQWQDLQPPMPFGSRRRVEQASGNFNGLPGAAGAQEFERTMQFGTRRQVEQELPPGMQFASGRHVEQDLPPATQFGGRRQVEQENKMQRHDLKPPGQQFTGRQVQPVIPQEYLDLLSDLTPPPALPSGQANDVAATAEIQEPMKPAPAKATKEVAPEIIAAREVAESGGGMSGMTSVMMKNVPSKYTQQKLMREINTVGFLGHYDFFYLPLQPHGHGNRGFAFINFSTPEAAQMFYTTFQGKQLRRFTSETPLAILPADVQGFEQNAEHYANLRMAPTPKRRSTQAGNACFFKPLPPHVVQMLGPEVNNILGQGSTSAGHAQGGQASEGYPAERPQLAGRIPNGAQHSHQMKNAAQSAPMPRSTGPQPPQQWAPTPVDKSPSAQSNTSAEASKQPMQRFCAFCGMSKPPSFIFCSYCGQKAPG
eukprot:TRINITY_DN26856_c0_g2_i1.p1 TRINITY_DN26856_c0_g2~~TRINITY_DN26856_c0_g2_i1.p1  ORF type:complete len:603 (+),score=92.39 TRINITY_DN26856_c0_g2_i1:72-1880(+)